ncbi:hypothetical protein Ahy_B01g055212 [Arachis hypogaea]|uniref:Uncharacterized protein n=1 Tax=Arachis hypogaea TaxID=3818 RepID=A0A445AVI9_ARAHY|nr:hypothetical protein Ahy_B01g055212 [Arachis hypogaea]
MPKLAWSVKRSIYFTDDRHDWSIFNLQKKYVKSLMQCTNKINPPPLWIVPAPQHCTNLHALKH